MTSDTTESSDKDVEKKPKKKLSEKLNVKWKNNLSQYVTIEPLLCIFLIRYLISTLQQPYNLVKKCENLDGDRYLCEGIANLSYFKNDNPVKWENLKRNITERSVDKAWNDPEDTRVYNMFDTATNSLEQKDYAITSIFAYIVQVLIIMLLSNFSDKHSKRKLCLWIPLLDQLLVSLVNIIGVLVFNIISYDYIRLSVIAIESLTGGQELLLFGCFSYMTTPTMKRNIFIGLGIIGLVVTILRNIPLNDFVQVSNISGDAYVYAILSFFFYILLCLIYVKVVLNELKREEIESTVEVTTKPSGDNGPSDEAENGTSDAAENGTSDAAENGSTTSTTKKKKLSMKEILAKAFFLDVIFDYIKLVIKDRKHKRRWIILLYLVITFVSSLWPYNKDCMVATFDVDFADKKSMKIDDYDFQGVLLAVILILVLYFKISDLTVAIIATIGPCISNLVFKSFQLTKWYALDIIHDDDGLYDRLFGLIVCSVLLVLVDTTEIRIYLVFKAVAFGTTTYIDKWIYKNQNAKISTNVLENYIIPAYSLLLILSLGFWLLFVMMKKSEKLNAEELEAKRLAAKAMPWKVAIAAQRLKTLASISSQQRQRESSNGQETALSHSSNGEAAPSHSSNGETAPPSSSNIENVQTSSL